MFAMLSHALNPEVKIIVLKFLKLRAHQSCSTMILKLVLPHSLSLSVTVS